MTNMVTNWTLRNEIKNTLNEENAIEWYYSPDYKIYNYLYSGDIITLCQRFTLLNALVKNGNKPFYSRDIFIDHSTMGGFINGLSLNGIIEKTGNSTITYIEINDDIYKKSTVYEWKLTMPAEKLATLIEANKNSIKELIELVSDINNM